MGIHFGYVRLPYAGDRAASRAGLATFCSEMLRLKGAMSPHPHRLPQPGEIWEVSRAVLSPMQTFETSPVVYSDLAQQFLWGDTPPRYVMVVREPAVDHDNPWQPLTVMVLSTETQFVSDRDILIPTATSGFETELLAETWHVLPMLGCNLLRPVGGRLSRTAYDLLMTVGDDGIDLPGRPSDSALKAAGLQPGTAPSRDRLDIQRFHRQEEAWSDVLRIPYARYAAVMRALGLVHLVLEEAAEIERYWDE